MPRPSPSRRVWATRRSRRIIASAARRRRRRRSIASSCGWGDDAKSPCTGRWTTTTSRRLTARPWSVEEELAAGRPPEEETWELTLRRPRSKPFEIRAQPGDETRRPGGDQPRLPARRRDGAGEAGDSRRGNESGADREPAAEADSHRARPAGSMPDACGRSIEYDPAVDASPAPEAPLLVWTTEATCVPRVWAWRGELRSRYAPDGGGQHAAVYRLQSCGETSVRLTLPRGTSREDVEGVWIDGLRRRGPPGGGRPAGDLDRPSAEREVSQRDDPIFPPAADGWG